MLLGFAWAGHDNSLSFLVTVAGAADNTKLQWLYLWEIVGLLTFLALMPGPPSTISHQFGEAAGDACHSSER